MSVQPAFLLIADIGGYTRFMKVHRMSLAHAQDIVSRLLEVVIETTSGRLTVAKLEGDAVFFYVAYPPGTEPDLGFVAGEVAAIYRAFHERIADLRASGLCFCDGCTQAGNLKIKFVGHVGEAAIHQVQRFTELAGVDVIVVHRMLKNAVPVPEYLLVTEPVLRGAPPDVKARAQPLSLDVADVGRLDTFFLDLGQAVPRVPERPRRWLLTRLALMMGRGMRTMPYLVGLRKPCADFRNLEGEPRPA